MELKEAILDDTYIIYDIEELQNLSFDEIKKGINFQ